MNESGRLRGPIGAFATALVAVVLVACSTGGDSRTNQRGRSDDPRAGGKSAFDTTAAPATSPTSEVIGGTTGPVTAATTVDRPDPGNATIAAIAAFHAALGPSDPARTLQFTIHFPVASGAYASLQTQDPSVPANVDERDWRDDEVSAPSPVVLNAPGDLEPRLFALDEVDWNAIATAIDGAPAAVIEKVGPLSNSDGVTHLIATKNLPFSPDTVVRVYVDGGDRSLGGYVQYRANGTLDKVQA